MADTSSSRTTSRIAFITGGAGGIGLATGQRLAKDGLTIVLADLDGEATQRAAALLPGSGHKGIALDVTSEASVADTFERIEFETGPIAVLCAFAGVVGNGPDGNQPTLLDLSLDVWNKTFAINSTGTFLCLREFVRKRSTTPIDHGRVITMSSSGAQLGGYQSKSAYCASKGAVLSLTKAAARELAPLGITVNAIAPGPIDTPMLRAARGAAQSNSTGYNVMSLLPAGRIGRPDEIAAAVAYLASAEAAFVTGSTLDVNGGMRMQ